MTYHSEAVFAGTDRITSLKADVDALLRQLSEGEYLSVDAFANNWVHLTALYARIQEQMNDRVLMDRLVRTDLLLTADLMAVGRMIMVMNNFLRCTASTR
ncbi:hypothetical protein HA42_13650 [Pantoea deleyi]|uniref:Uncharacterized protein n=1 Tax=Pantoea deleyi TaxID=470932 RepID=A0A506QMS5_9GAMM|nr:hypothetical protein [Pantoea deleyi]ORM80670.1 hypothetical protein HA42_13650 [Pantoea deleyi]TPV47552.1 hypothetical protein FJW01_03575 [Pantoea deleyi]